MLVYSATTRRGSGAFPRSSSAAPCLALQRKPNPMANHLKYQRLDAQRAKRCAQMNSRRVAHLAGIVRARCERPAGGRGLPPRERRTAGNPRRRHELLPSYAASSTRSSYWIGVISSRSPCFSFSTPRRHGACAARREARHAEAVQSGSRSALRPAAVLQGEASGAKSSPTRFFRSQ